MHTRPRATTTPIVIIIFATIIIVITAAILFDAQRTKFHMYFPSAQHFFGCQFDMPMHEAITVFVEGDAVNACHHFILLF
jgi:hypothetical protein